MEHMNTHSDEKPFSCFRCSETFSKKFSLAIHELTHSDERLFSCSRCPKTFQRKDYLMEHMNTHSDEKPFSCSRCSEAFSKKFRLAIHELTHTDEKLFTCTVCSKTFTRKGSLIVHMQAHTGEKPFLCTVCSIAFTLKKNLRRHELMHTSESSFNCTVCSKTFRRKDYLTDHMKTHSNERAYSCTVCEKTFQRKDYLTDHMKTHSNERAYSCTDCEKTFRRREHLTRHKKTHTDDRPYSCSSCSKTFRRREYLTKHEATHTDEGPSTCSVCSKSYKCKTSFKKHMKIHEEETSRRITDESPSTFVHGNAVGLEKHVEAPHRRTHDNRLCPRTFNREDQLSVHVDNEHPYECQPVCGYEELTRRKDQVRNEMVESLQRTHDCRLCPRTFRHEDQLSVHVDNEHPYECQPVCGYEELTRRKDKVWNEMVESLQRTHDCRLCPRTFRHEDQLSVHVDNEYPYECQPVCRYEELTRRKDQVRNEMVEYPHNCRLCPRTFRHKDQLSVHVDNEHPYACQPVCGCVEWMKRKCHSHGKR
ncbi:zinc finger protein OZF-like [Copidosoma floridanum]|uniref:zinc finger protein OZF-like n=1 Tax=Copidosoma floridanum TaxID=29053 RepID=UPI0006C9AAE6|nr:zinc finger protein OZF-like [Copidosoma floridanum]